MSLLCHIFSAYCWVPSLHSMVYLILSFFSLHLSFVWYLSTKTSLWYLVSSLQTMSGRSKCKGIPTRTAELDDISYEVCKTVCKKKSWSEEKPLVKSVTRRGRNVGFPVQHSSPFPVHMQTTYGTYAKAYVKHEVLSLSSTCVFQAGTIAFKAHPICMCEQFSILTFLESFIKPQVAWLHLSHMCSTNNMKQKGAAGALDSAHMNCIQWKSLIHWHPYSHWIWLWDVWHSWSLIWFSY